MQRERVTAPRGILPAAEIREQLRPARLANEREIVEAQLLEAAPKVSVLPYLARDEKPARTGREAREVDVALERVVQPG